MRETNNNTYNNKSGVIVVAILVMFATHVAAKSVNIQDEYLDPCIGAEAAFLSKAVYQLDGVFGAGDDDDFYDPSIGDILKSNSTSGKYSNLSWMDVGSTEVLVSRKTTDENENGDTTSDFGFGIPPESAIVTFRGSEEIDDWIVNVDQFMVSGDETSCIGNRCGCG